MSKSQTPASTPRLSEFAREFVFPKNISMTVWPRVESKGRELGLGFDWWQSQLGTVCLGYDEHGKYVATVGGIGLSIPRQVGKTYFVLALLIILCILFPGFQVVWTSHHLRTTNKTLTTARGMARRKKIAPHVRAVRTSHGEGQVEFVNGSMIMFGARSQGFGRGFDEIDVEVFDEAQILDTKALEDMIAATNQARHEHGALLFFMGTPPRPTDPSEAFKVRRQKALDGRAKNAIWLEIGADPDSAADDRVQWPLMNPSFPKRTPAESVERLRENLADDDSWNREGRGIWDPLDPNSGAFPPVVWYRQKLDDVGRLSEPVAAVDAVVGLKQSAALVICGVTDGQQVVHVARHEPESSQGFVDEVVKILKPRGIRSVALDMYGENQNLVPLFEAAGFTVHQLNQGDMRNACTGFSDALINRNVWHRNQAPLNRAVTGSGARKTDAGLVYSQLKSTTDQTPLRAAAVAWFIFQSGVAANYDVMKSAY